MEEFRAGRQGGDDEGGGGGDGDGEIFARESREAFGGDGGGVGVAKARRRRACAGGVEAEERGRGREGGVWVGVGAGGAVGEGDGEGRARSRGGGAREEVEERVEGVARAARCVAVGGAHQRRDRLEGSGRSERRGHLRANGTAARGRAPGLDPLRRARGEKLERARSVECSLGEVRQEPPELLACRQRSEASFTCVSLKAPRNARRRASEAPVVSRGPIGRRPTPARDGESDPEEPSRGKRSSLGTPRS